MAASHIFKVLFANQGKVYEIYARKVSHGSLFGFIEASVFVDPDFFLLMTQIPKTKTPGS